MEFLGNHQTYNTYGASLIYSPVADLLMLRLEGKYGTAINSIYFTAILKNETRNPRPTLEKWFDSFHSNLDKFPKVTFRRNLKRMQIEFLSHHFTADDERRNSFNFEKCNIACQEVAQALKLISKRIKPEDDFDLARFLQDADRALATKVGSTEELEKIRQEAKSRRQALYASKDPWELLEIDWTKFHHRAREILDDPFFWQLSNDFAPNGNDTGADLLADYRRWDKRNLETSPMVFLTRLIRGWGISPIDWAVIESKEVSRLGETDPIALTLCNESMIALAFAVIKCRGSCPSDIVQFASAALERTLILVKSSTLSDDIKTRWDQAVMKMRKKLQSISELA